MGDTLNMIGIIMRMGLVTRNAILPVDNANERRVAGAGRLTARVEAGRERLRPTLMTTRAMIFGMLPIAMATGALRAPMARAVTGGLITSTVLTLGVVPVAYSYPADFSTGLRPRRRAERPVATLSPSAGDAAMNLSSGFGAPPAEDAGGDGGAGWLHAEAPLPAGHGGVVPDAVHPIRGSLTVLLMGAEPAARPGADPAQRAELHQGVRAALGRIDGSLAGVRGWLARELRAGGVG